MTRKWRINTCSKMTWLTRSPFSNKMRVRSDQILSFKSTRLNFKSNLSKIKWSINWPIWTLNITIWKTHKMGTLLLSWCQRHSKLLVRSHRKELQVASIYNFRSLNISINISKAIRREVEEIPNNRYILIQEMIILNMEVSINLCPLKKIDRLMRVFPCRLLKRNWRKEFKMISKSKRWKPVSPSKILTRPKT